MHWNDSFGFFVCGPKRVPTATSHRSYFSGSFLIDFFTISINFYFQFPSVQKLRISISEPFLTLSFL